MNSVSFLRISTMKPTWRILFSCRNSAFFGFPPAKCVHSLAINRNSTKICLNLEHSCRFQAGPARISGFRQVFNETRKGFRVPSWRFSQSGVISKPCDIGTSNRGVSVIANVASKARNLSTSIETRVNENNFERIYVQGGVNVKPLVVERIDKDESIVGGEDSGVQVGGEKVSIESREEGLSEVQVEVPKREESEIEKQAWKLLENAVVTYCGSPVGTVAANDPGDKLPLNYDQVFIRDFVPSALAFLLKGEGEIVRNFLLHTLQLQVFAHVYLHCIVILFRFQAILCIHKLYVLFLLRDAIFSDNT